MKTTILYLLLLCTAMLHAQTTLSPIFGNGMVLQRNTKVALWGKDKAKTKIVVEASWGTTATTQTDKDGKWKVFVESLDAGGPYTIKVIGSSKVELTDILLGEVWLCSGQSNMEMPVKGNVGQPVFGSQEAIMNSTNPNIRLFKVERRISTSPTDTVQGTWQHCTPNNVANFSAAAYFYGRLLQAQLGVPIGLICSAWGGTPSEAWTPKETLNSQFPEFNKKIEQTSDYYQRTPTGLYNGMIHPLIPFTIKGVIWYQGEANKSRAKQYQTLFPAMIQSWRERWGLGEFPFYFVQVAPLQWGGLLWPQIRESQLIAWRNTSNTGMAVTLDIGQPSCIHPPYKKEVGERLAYWALNKTYGFDHIQYSGPVYKSMEIKEHKIHLSFDYAPNGLTDLYRGLSGFEICGADSIFHEAEASITKGELVVWNEDIANPVAVRYGWMPYFKGCLFNTAGLPASSFRTDDFPYKKE